MGSLFGGSKSSSESYNKSYEDIKNSFLPLLSYAGEGAGGMSRLLGGDASGLDAYKKALGYDWELGQGLASTLANTASRGLAGSGATLKALAKYQTGLNNQYAGTYLDQLLNLANTGFNAGTSLINAGQYSKSKSKQTAGLAPLIGAATSFASAGAGGGF